MSLIKDVDLIDESKECFLTYAEEVLTDRAIPNAEDGLLSVHRKILWTASEVLKMNSKSKFKKSASIVGTTLSSSYYHGDAACYSALCKISQPYLMRYPLIEGQGNLGSQMENGTEASARYTEAKPSIFADLMMLDFKKNIVPLKPTYNEEYMEPVFLPALFPNAIVNGREAIGLAMAHNSLPNNLTETCNAIIARLRKNASLTIAEVLENIKGPDFPLGGVVINSKDIKAAFETGRSVVSLKVRGDYEIDKNIITFTSIPYRTYRNKIKEQINKNIDIFENLLDDFSDESNLGENKLVFKCAKDVMPEQVLEQLFALTDLQTSLSYNMNFIVAGTPKLCSMMDLIDAYVEHQTNILLKIAEFDKAKAEARKHIIEGLLIIITNIDKAIHLIRESNDRQEAKKGLEEVFHLTEKQASAVLDMKLAQLTKLDKNDLVKELEEKELIIAECHKILTDEAFRNSKLIEKVTWLRDKYGDKRRTQLDNVEIVKPKKKDVKDMISSTIVIFDKSGKVKRATKATPKDKKESFGIIETTTADTILLFTNTGNLHLLKVKDLKEEAQSLSNLLALAPNERIMRIYSKDMPISNATFICFITKKGQVKRTRIEDFYDNCKARGKKKTYMTLADEDEIIFVRSFNSEDIVIGTAKGYFVKIEQESINPVASFTSKGVKLMKLKEGDYITAVDKALSGDEIIAEDVNGKIYKCQEYASSPRGASGTRIAVAGIKQINVTYLYQTVNHKR